MTGRNSGGVRSRNGLTGIVAAATIIAASLLGLAWAQGRSEDRQKSHRQGKQRAQATQPAQKAPDTTSTGTVTRTIGGATVSVDPVTGRLQMPTPEEAAKLTAALYKMVSRETENLLIIEKEDGSVMASLDDSYQEVIMGTKDKKGNIRLHCVNTPAQVDLVLSGAANKGPIYNIKADGRAGKKGGKRAPAPAETE